MPKADPNPTPEMCPRPSCNSATRRCRTGLHVERRLSLGDLAVAAAAAAWAVVMLVIS
ncbi:MAG TPA: hypothetical protein VME47_14775 [Acetobacteraceae bacterium]|nr:hypothetical protein [Acetobacteraceae bacterium]